MVNIRNIVQKNKKISNVIFIVSLIIIPLININQGLDITDSTYSLGNYLFFDKLEGVWVLSTYLSNVIGAAIVRLPYGNMLIGANFYTGLIVGLIAILAYLFFSKILGQEVAFLGEVIALCYCWIPSGILYNYLSYLLMVVGVWLLFIAIEREKNIFLLLAGIVFGLNVFVRIPNITQMAFIIVLWIAAYIKKRSFNECIKDTAICISGYIVGVLIAIVMISIQYGISNIPVMLNGLTGIAKSDETYTPVSMIIDTIAAYINSIKWIAIICGTVLVGLVIFAVCKNKYSKVKTVIFIFIVALMLRFLWGHGMYSFRYYEDYSSMYEWGMVALYLSVGASIYTLLSKKFSINYKLMAMIAIITIVIAPLGSNNYTYQNLNNMFLVLPFTIKVIVEVVKKLASKSQILYTRPIMIMLVTLILCIAIQGIGFHANFVFRDGTRGEKRDTKIENVASLRGIYTSKDKANSISELSSYMASIDAKEALYYGDCPGLAYVLGIPSAISTTWPDLDSYSSFEFENELVENKTSVIIIRNDSSYISNTEKSKILYDIIETKNYNISFSNLEFEVYITEG